MYEPLKVALGGLMGRYFDQLYPTTKPLHNYVNRPLDKAIAWSPGRMKEFAEEQLSLWFKHDFGSGSSSGFTELPAIIVAMDKSTEAKNDLSHAYSDENYVRLRGDEKSRIFKLRRFPTSVRVQVVFFAHDEPTTRSLAAQFLMFMKSLDNRRLPISYCFASIDNVWLGKISKTDEALDYPIAVDNLTISLVDFNVETIIPFYTAPKLNEPNDGNGTHDITDPAGYPVIIRAENSINVETIEYITSAVQ